MAARDERALSALETRNAPPRSGCEPGGQQVRALRERYRVQPHRLRPDQSGPVNRVVRLADETFRTNSVLNRRCRN
jgi:hypothetical protein